MNRNYETIGTAAKLRERASALRTASGGNAAPPIASTAPVPAVKLVTPQSAVREAIAYAKWLALPPGKRRQCVPLGTAGKALYERTLADMRREAAGSVVLNEAKSVLARLDRMQGGGVVKLIRGGSVRLAPVQKFLSGSTRMVRGWASTDDLDRQGDIVVPSGMKATLPLPLLWMHSHSLPVGSIRSAEVKAGGIWIEASLVEGVAQADEAWKLVEGGAVDSFSIGFRVLKSEPLPGGGLRIVSWELLETSLVSVPANPAAKIRR